MQVLVTSAGQDTVFVFAPETQTPTVGGPDVPQTPISVPSALEEAPLVLVVSLTTPALAEGTSAATTPLPAAGLNAVAGVAGGDMPEEGRLDTVGINDGGREEKDAIPGLDEALRRLRLYRPSEPMSAGPRSERKGAEEELDAGAVMGWEAPLSPVDGGQGRTAQESRPARPDGSGEPSYEGNLSADGMADVSGGEAVRSEELVNESAQARGGVNRQEFTDANTTAEQRSVWRGVIAALASIGLAWWRAEVGQRARRQWQSARALLKEPLHRNPEVSQHVGQV
jgi:hypothetical protein